MTTFDEYLSRITDAYTSTDYSKELSKARKEYFDFIGTVHEEDPFYESYMDAFMEWYLFARDLTDQDLPPVRMFYRTKVKEFSDEEKKIYSDFTKNRHTIFVAKRVTSSTIVLQDLFRNDKLKLENNFPTIGFNSGDIFEAILVPFNNQYMFTKSFVFHPAETKSFIVKEMKRIANLELNIMQKAMLRLKRLRLKFDRYPHVSPSQIYTTEEFNRYA